MKKSTQWLRYLALATLTLAAVAAFLGKDWLTGIGLSSLVLALLPCALMCAAGLCMRRSPNQNAAAPPQDSRR